MTAQQRARANLAAIRAEMAVRAGTATAQERAALAGWSGWGAIPEVFDARRDRGWSLEVRRELQSLLSAAEFEAARRSTLTAFYTDSAYTTAMWDAAAELGFTRGIVLEPGCGAGAFVGSAPRRVEVVGVEVDPVTARIAAARWPHAQIRQESFTATPARDGGYDVVIGNVPFGDVVPHDPEHNAARHAVHNYFLIKSLHLTRPGGLVLALTSRFTMDATDPAARRDLAELADLVGAVRLPGLAHSDHAGTEVVTDLLILRRREPERAPSTTAWLHSIPLSVGSDTVAVNEYWHTHPAQVLGQLRLAPGMHNAATLHVDATIRSDRSIAPQIAGRLTAALEPILTHAQASGLVLAPRPADKALADKARVEVYAPAGVVTPSPRSAAPAPGTRTDAPQWDGQIARDEAGAGFVVASGGRWHPLAVPRAQHREVAALVALGQSARTVLELEAATGQDTVELATTRAQLATQYQAYLARYGPLNRYTTRATGRTDDQGQPRTARITPPAVRTFRADPAAALVLALEHFDDTTATARAADIQTRRVIVPRQVPDSAETPEDALAICRERLGRVDLDVVADLLGVTAQQAREALGTLVFHDPETDVLVPAAEYCSGDVRRRLGVAQAAVDQGRDEFAVNVTALRAVLPEDVPPQDMHARLGAVWIDAATHTAFVREILADPRAVIENPGGAIWEVQAAKYSVQATHEWGTARMPAGDILAAVLEQRPIQVHDTIALGDGTTRRVLNAEESAAAQEKAEALQERFGEWVFEDPTRGLQLAAEYNRRFNSLVLRDYSTDGDHLRLPGLAATFIPAPHQRAAVARMLSEPAVGLFHVVGAGKTAEMVIGAMELRRLGMVTKPCVVVPNHMLEQITREWLQMYPRAQLLAAGSGDLAGDKRRQFVARVATGDWDAVVMTRTAFERLPMSHSVQESYLREQTQTLRGWLEVSKGGAGLAVKRIERMVAAAEERLKGVLDGAKDQSGVTFENTGIDYLIVDEAHDYKNLRTTTNIPGAAIEGARRASDLEMKLSWLRETHGERVVTFATATPIANSITEAHVMMRYLRPDLLQAAGIDNFDAWAATFAQTVTAIEMAPAGDAFRQSTRVARFNNIPEMLLIWGAFADVRTAADLNLPTPALAPRSDGQAAPETVIVASTAQLKAFIADLAERAEAVRSRIVKPDVDNMLKITTEGRFAALDTRAVGAGYPMGPTKIDAAADRIARVWVTHADHVYTDPTTGADSPIPGALQIVFCDTSTPTGRGWNAYDELRDQLTARGIPTEQIRYIHDAKTDADKARLFTAARQGHVAVLIGSTQKMGVGTNIQHRAIALHHLDCPWRPADLEQREGRIMRQGNQNPQISIYRYVTEGSFDVYSWQTVERKARFIEQVTRGRLNVRDVDDISETALSYAEVKALASGDPLILAKATADAELAKLERLARAHTRAETMLRTLIQTNTLTLARLERDIPRAEATAAAAIPTRGDAFAMTIHGHRITHRAEAANILARDLHTAATNAIRAGRGDVDLGTIAQIGGHDVRAELHVNRQDPRERLLQLQVADLDSIAVSVNAIGTGSGIIQRLEHLINDVIPSQAAKLQAAYTQLTAENDTATARLNTPFARANDLAAARRASTSIEAQMTQQVTQEFPHDPTLQPQPLRPTTPGASLGRTYERRIPPNSTPAPHTPRPMT